MDIHEAYDTIKRYFSEPGAQLSSSPNGDCYYRHPDDGRKCAAGCLIADSEYDTFWEGSSAEDVPVFSEDILPFVSEVQKAHDTSSTVSDFLEKLDIAYSDHNQAM